MNIFASVSPIAKLLTSKDSKTYELLLLQKNVSNALSVRVSEKMSAIVARYDIDESFLEISIDILKRSH